MKILAIDTGADLCAACIFETASDTHVSVVREIGKGHAEQLMEVIAEALAEAGCGFPELDRVVVNAGPGSFTGIRVGVAAARGLALALGIPSVGVSSLDAIAAETAIQFPERPIMAVIDARRGEFYYALYGPGGSPESGPKIVSAADAAAVPIAPNPVFAGSGAAKMAEISAIKEPDFGPVVAARILTYARLGEKADPSEKPKPLYLRPPDAKPQSGFALSRAAI